ncbi:bifunctional DNA primase/polymerase [Mycolicibacterium fortuitum]|uniref:bifunctional DNA primase/polymerase n=1 Tax=Mycolicibacterium fortuitum TaxID=1766 RepID=UPI00148F5332|nr:hypothetical protein [Mycolicibacterium fortuitum]
MVHGGTGKRAERPFSASELEANRQHLLARDAGVEAWARNIIASGAHAIPLVRARKRPAVRRWQDAPAMPVAMIVDHLRTRPDGDRPATEGMYGGGNIGVHLGASGANGWIAWDADAADAAQALQDAGYPADTIPANAGNPAHAHAGGRHRFWSVPAAWGVKGRDLTLSNFTVTLANGGKVDVLVGDRYAVLPPSYLNEPANVQSDTEPAFPAFYAASSGGVMSGVVPPELPVEFWPEHFLDACGVERVEPDPAVAALRVPIKRKTVLEAAEERCLGGSSGELSEKIDAVPMSTWREMDTLGYIQDSDKVSSCGCAKGHCSLQSSPTPGLELHDGCAYGHSVHVYSGSTMAHLAANGQHEAHMSWPAFIAGMYGREFADVCREAGIEMRSERPELGSITAGDFEQWADEYEQAGNHAQAQAMREQAAKQRAAVHAWMVTQGEVFLTQPVVGAVTPEPEPEPEPERPTLTVIQGGLDPAPPIGNLGGPAPAVKAGLDPAPQIGTLPTAAEKRLWTDENGQRVQPSTPTSPIGPMPSAPVPETAHGGGAVDHPPSPAPDAQPQTEARVIQQKARKALLYASEAALLDRIFCTELMAGIRERSRLAMVSPTMQLLADLSGVLSLVPPDVQFPPILGEVPSGFNFAHAVVARSGSGKGGSKNVTFEPAWPAAEGGWQPPQLPPKVPSGPAPGSGEVMANFFARIEEDENGVLVSVPKNAAARWYWPEITKIDAVKGKSGSTFSSELCQAWSSEDLGSLTKNSPGFCEAHTYRVCMIFGAQVLTIGTMYDPDASGMGLSQRLWLVSGVDPARPEKGSPEYEELMRTRHKPTKWLLVLPFFKPGEVEVDDEVAYEMRVIKSDLDDAEETREVELATHTALMRARLALAASIYHGEGCAITMKWWRWTEHLEEHHLRVRRAAEIAMSVATIGKTESEGRNAARRESARGDAQHALEMQKALVRARAGIGIDGGFTAGELAQTGRYRGYRRENAEALAESLVAAGLFTKAIESRPHHGDLLCYRVSAAGMTEDVYDAA